MKALTRFVTSSIGMKVIMALTGLMMVGFVAAHLSGNLLMFAGQDTINDYAEWLHSLGPLLYLARAGLLAAFVAHIVVAIRLSKQNRAAKPKGYVHENTVPISFASKYTLETGLVILAFVVVHLLHFTWKVLNPEYSELVDAEGREDVFSMVVIGFKDPVFAVGYIIALLCVGTHLSHAIHSCLQTIGISNDDNRQKLESLSKVIGWGLALGFIAIPTAVLTGIIQLPGAA